MKTALSLKMTLSVATGAPGNSQFMPSDQLTVVALSLPSHTTEGRTPTGPLVMVSKTAF